MTTGFRFPFPRLLLSLAVLAGLSVSAFAKTYEVMLQGFKWQSADNGLNWFNIIKDNSQRIKDSGFTICWFPPVSDSSGGVGYYPQEWYKISAGLGGFTSLTNAIKNLKNRGIKPMADVVINHRNGVGSWYNFVNPSMSTYCICKNDEWDGNIGSGADYRNKSVNDDTGTGDKGCRDLDHKNPEVQNAVKAYMNWMKNTLGFDGWRYDMVKGYGASYIGMYNGANPVSFTVGEYMDGNPNSIMGWIDGTDPNSALRATAFDFPLREAIRNAVWGNYHYLNYSGKVPGILGMWSDKTVTFIENHDTEECRNGAYYTAFPGGTQMLMGYAYILTHPGTPCVFWADIFDSGSYNEWRIRDMISVRKNYKIHSQSSVYIAYAVQNSGYAAYIQGDNGEIAVKIGPVNWAPSGSKWAGRSPIAYGTDWAIWGDHN